MITTKEHNELLLLVNHKLCPNFVNFRLCREKGEMILHRLPPAGHFNTSSLLSSGFMLLRVQFYKVKRDFILKIN